MVAVGIRTHNESVIDTVRRFLQTVVVMDDGAQYNSPPAATAVTTTQAPGRGGKEQEDQKDATEVDQPQGHALDTAVLVDAFADRGLVCGVLKPINEDDTAASERTLKAAKRADILVLDWEIGQAQGTVVCDIIKQIMANDQKERLRLIAIYTACDGLADIAATIKATLATPNGRYQPILGEGDEQFTVFHGPCKIVVYAKEGVHTAGTRSIPEANLPDVLIGEFASLASGLLSNLAVASLGAIREHAHQLLQRFGSEIDAAYLIHRSLLRVPEDAEQQAVALIAAEIESLLEDSGVISNVGPETISRWVENHVDNVSLADLPFPGDKDTAASFITAVAVSGVSGDGIKSTYPQIGWLPDTGKDPKARILPQLGKSVSCRTDYNGNEQFGMLMTMHQNYNTGTDIYYLRLGTICASTSDGLTTYWICLQPSCDCIRLKGTRSFLMLQAMKVDPADANACYNLLLPGEETLRLHVDEQVYNLSLFDFQPSTGNDKIMAVRDASDKPIFTDINGRVFRQIGELRRQHALSIAHTVSSQLSRIGTTTCEYLRLSGKKK